jgi:hypothetical protein
MKTIENLPLELRQYIGRRLRDWGGFAGERQMSWINSDFRKAFYESPIAPSVFAEDMLRSVKPTGTPLYKSTLVALQNELPAATRLSARRCLFDLIVSEWMLMSTAPENVSATQSYGLAVNSFHRNSFRSFVDPIDRGSGIPFPLIPFTLGFVQLWQMNPDARPDYYDLVLGAKAVITDFAKPYQPEFLESEPYFLECVRDDFQPGYDQEKMSRYHKARKNLGGFEGAYVALLGLAAHSLLALEPEQREERMIRLVESIFEPGSLCDVTSKTEAMLQILSALHLVSDLNSKVAILKRCNNLANEDISFRNHEENSAYYFYEALKDLPQEEYDAIMIGAQEFDLAGLIEARGDRGYLVEWDLPGSRWRYGGVDVTRRQAANNLQAMIEYDAAQGAEHFKLEFEDLRMGLKVGIAYQVLAKQTADFKYRRNLCRLAKDRSDGRGVH